jgi:hypothetical protein
VSASLGASLQEDGNTAVPKCASFKKLTADKAPPKNCYFISVILCSLSPTHDDEMQAFVWHHMVLFKAI